MLYNVAQLLKESVGATRRYEVSEPAQYPEEGWGALHQMAQDDAQASNVRLAAAQEPIARVLDRTGMLRLFALDGSRADAIAALQGG